MPSWSGKARSPTQASRFVFPDQISTGLLMRGPSRSYPLGTTSSMLLIQHQLWSTTAVRKGPSKSLLHSGQTNVQKCQGLVLIKVTPFPIWNLLTNHSLCFLVQSSCTYAHQTSSSPSSVMLCLWSPSQGSTACPPHVPDRPCSWRIPSPLQWAPLPQNRHNNPQHAQF